MVSMLAHSFLIESSAKLLVTRTGINFGVTCPWMTKIPHFQTSLKPVGQSWSYFICNIIGVGERLHKVLGQIDLGTLDSMSNHCPLGYYSSGRSLPFGLFVFLTVERARKIWVILRSRKQSHAKIPWFFINFQIPQLFPIHGIFFCHFPCFPPSCLFGFNVAFNKFSGISRRCLVASGSSLLTFIVFLHWSIMPQTLDMIPHPVTLSWHCVDQS